MFACMSPDFAKFCTSHKGQLLTEIKTRYFLNFHKLHYSSITFVFCTAITQKVEGFRRWQEVLRIHVLFEEEFSIFHIFLLLSQVTCHCFVSKMPILPCPFTVFSLVDGRFKMSNEPVTWWQFDVLLLESGWKEILCRRQPWTVLSMCKFKELSIWETRAVHFGFIVFFHSFYYWDACMAQYGCLCMF